MTAKARILPKEKSMSKNGSIPDGIQISLTPSIRSYKAAGGVRAGGSAIVKFGSVTVRVPEPAISEVQRNIKAGQSALARAAASIVRAGVKLNVSKGVPLFHAHPTLPGQLVREIDGARDYGTFVNGTFRAIR